MLSVTREVELADPAAAAFASRWADDRWFCWEEPERGFALAGIGTAAEVVSRGPGRFGDVAAACARFLRDRLREEPEDLPGGAGPTWVGGFAFDEDGGGSPHWSSLPPALLVLPEVTIVRHGDRSYLTACARSGDENALQRVERRLAALNEAPLPLLDPAPAAATAVRSVAEPSSFEASVARAVERIGEGGLEKVVLAREVRAEAPRAHDPAAVFGALRELFPSCFCFCV